MSLEFHTNQELIDELFKRESFKGIMLYGSGDKNNVQEGNGGCRFRVSRGMVVQDILVYMKVGLDSLHQMFPAAFVKFFGSQD